MGGIFIAIQRFNPSAENLWQKPEFSKALLFLVGGWTNPFEKYARQNWESSPQGSGWTFKKMSCHHLVFFYQKKRGLLTWRPDPALSLALPDGYITGTTKVPTMEMLMVLNPRNWMLERSKWWILSRCPTNPPFFIVVIPSVSYFWRWSTMFQKTNNETVELFLWMG